MTIIRKIIRTDGTEEELPGPITMAEARERIGAQTLDVVLLRHLGWPLHVMLVDDAGYVTMPLTTQPGVVRLQTLAPRKPINEKATALYHANCRPGTSHRIVGDVVIVPDADEF